MSLTPSGRFRRRRDLVLLACRRAGVPAALLADAFDLARSRVSTLLAEAGAEFAAETGREPTDATDPEFADWLAREVGKTGRSRAPRVGAARRGPETDRR